MKRYVVGFAFNTSEERVALISKRRPSWQSGLLNGIGGHIDDDESPLEAMDREFEEEAGAVAAWTLFALLSGDGYEVYFFRGVVATGSVETLTDERVDWYDPDNLPESVIPNLRWLVPMARSRQRHDWPFRIFERTALPSPEARP